MCPQSYFQPASTQCDVDPVCVPRAIFNLPQPSVMLILCVSPELFSTCLNPVWCWSSVCPHRAIVNLLQPASTQCDIDPVCACVCVSLYIMTLSTWCQLISCVVCSKRTIGVGTITVRPVSTDRVRVICGKCHKVILVSHTVFPPYSR